MFDIKSFYEAKDVADAIRALEMDPDAEIISGGTDVLIRVREGKDAGRSLVSVHNLQELKGVKLLENGDLWIGAGTAFCNHLHAGGKDRTKHHNGTSAQNAFRQRCKKVSYRRKQTGKDHAGSACHNGKAVDNMSHSYQTYVL